MFGPSRQIGILTVIGGRIQIWKLRLKERRSQVCPKGWSEIFLLEWSSNGDNFLSIQPALPNNSANQPVSTEAGFGNSAPGLGESVIPALPFEEKK